MTIALPGYFNRFDATDRYDELLFRASKGLQSAELNEVQSTVIDRLTRIADSVFRDGTVIEGTVPLINKTTGATTCPVSRVYLRGAVREVPERTFTIPTAGTVQVGVFLLTAEITEDQDATLRDPAPGTRNYQEPGAGRLRITPQWGHDGETINGEFYAAYLVVDGELFTQTTANTDSAFYESLARYDRESNGNYIVQGLSVLALGSGVFSVQEGVGNIFGYKVDKPSASRLTYADDPDLESVTSEPDTYTNSSTPLQLNRYPVQAITEVVATLEKTVTLTRGGASGGQDALPDVSVVSLVEVKQGGTTYTATTDYFLNGDQVDWSPAGIEPAPGSTYTVKYRYLTNVTPQNINLNAGTFTVDDAVAGTLILTDYLWKLPRLDRICINREGAFVRVKGLASRYTPQAPTISESLLSLATIEQKWTGTPAVQNDGIKAIPFSQLQQMRSLVNDLFELVSIERLERDIASAEPSSKLGVFVDPFLDDDMRDQGITQDAAVVGGVLMLPLKPSPFLPGTNNSADQLLPFTQETILRQELATNSERINPYQSFDPLGATIVLNPAVDRWTELDVSTTVFRRRSWWNRRWWWWGWLGNSGDTTISDDWEAVTFSGTVADAQLAPWIRGRRQWRRLRRFEIDREPVAFLRQIPIQFTISGFVSGETLTQLRFDGITVTPSPAPVANASGVITSTFTIPANVPTGVKAVTALGSQSTFGSAEFFGEGEEITVTRIRRRRARRVDPLAQTFRLEQSRWITSMDVQFKTIGSADNPVVLEIREVELGLPNSVSLAEGTLDMSTVSTTGWTRINLDRPVWLQAEVEYAMVLLSDDAFHAVSIAQGGQYDPVAERFVTSQPYTVGTLLKSSNASTWTPFQEADLTFKLNAATFTSTSQIIELGPISFATASSLTRSSTTATLVATDLVELLGDVQTGDTIVVSGAAQGSYNGAFVVTVVDANTVTFTVTGSPVTPATGTILVAPGLTSDLLTVANVERPTNATNVEFIYAKTDGSTIRSSVDGRVQLTERITQGMSLSMQLTGTATESPYVFAGTQAILGNTANSAIYASRAFTCQANARVSITFEGYVPSAASVVVEVQKSDSTWQTVSQTASVSIGDGWAEYQHQVATFTAGGTTTRVRLTLNGTPAARPFVRQLRAVVI
jgi:hypothetical protein